VLRNLSATRLLDRDQLIGLANQTNELSHKIDAFAAERKAIFESVGLAALKVEPELEVRASSSTGPSPRGKNPEYPSEELHLRLQHAELECDR
jgi:hypothetical protein